jgi:hypothetical protein
MRAFNLKTSATLPATVARRLPESAAPRANPIVGAENSGKSGGFNACAVKIPRFSGYFVWISAILLRRR